MTWFDFHYKSSPKKFDVVKHQLKLWREWSATRKIKCLSHPLPCVFFSEIKEIKICSSWSYEICCKFKGSSEDLDWKCKYCYMCFFSSHHINHSLYSPAYKICWGIYSFYAHTSSARQVVCTYVPPKTRLRFLAKVESQDLLMVANWYFIWGCISMRPAEIYKSHDLLTYISRSTDFGFWSDY